MINEVSVSEMQKLVADGALLVDVREREELEIDGTIPGMIHMALSNFESYENVLDKTRPVVFYCRSGKRSLKAAEIAALWTEQNLYSLRGGIIGYKQAGL